MDSNPEQLPDELNPEFAFGQTANQLLAQFMADPMELIRCASLTLASRGLDDDGNWVGFARALTLHNLRMQAITVTKE